MITIDGAAGEGGGQILRSALALSLVTGQPFEIRNIRAGREKPGLMRQHLMCVRAAATTGQAEVAGDTLGSQHLVFTPGEVRPGDYDFAIGTAGSTGLVLQTVLLPLALAPSPSRLVISGGTHNHQAPSFDFLHRAYLPLLRRMGFAVDATLTRTGFYPAGGGEVVIEISTAKQFHTFSLRERGSFRAAQGLALVANLACSIGERELAVLGDRLGWPKESLRVESRPGAGPGNCAMAWLDYDEVTELFTAFGRTGVSAERVGHELSQQVRAYLAVDAPVGPHLADQLLLPLAMGGGGDFITGEPTEHSLTHSDIINRFIAPRTVDIVRLDEWRWYVSVKGMRLPTPVSKAKVGES